MPRGSQAATHPHSQAATVAAVLLSPIPCIHRFLTIGMEDEWEICMENGPKNAPEFRAVGRGEAVWAWAVNAHDVVSSRREDSNG